MVFFPFLSVMAFNLMKEKYQVTVSETINSPEEVFCIDIKLILMYMH